MAWILLPAIEQAMRQDLSVTLATEVLSSREVIPSRRLPVGVEYRVATVDGSWGVQGSLTPLLPDLLRWADLVLAAASPAFYRALAPAVQNARYALNRGFVQTLYPATILCGTGACQACVADVAGGRSRVCLRGPVFDLVDLPL
jgi:NAD(P)H-flavin reductase